MDHLTAAPFCAWPILSEIADHADDGLIVLRGDRFPIDARRDEDHIRIFRKFENA